MTDGVSRQPLLDDDFIARCEKLSLISRAVAHGRIRGERRSKRRGFSTEFADHRDYVPGDDLRYLDWNIYGRLDRLFIKLFEEEEDLTVCILLDTSESMVSGEPDKFRYARQVAAALGVVALSTGDRVGIWPFDRDLRAPFRPMRGRRHASLMLKWLEDLDSGDGTDLQGALESFQGIAPRRGMVILISDLLDPQGSIDALRLIAGGGRDSYLFHLLSPQELDPQIAGDLRLVDIEDRSTTEISVTRALLDGYRNTVSDFMATVRQSCSRYQIQPLFTSTAAPFDEVVLGYLRQRRMLG